MRRLANSVFSNFILDMYSMERAERFPRHALAVLNEYIPCVAVAYAVFERSAPKHEVKEIYVQRPNRFSRNDVHYVNSLIASDHPYIPHFRTINSSALLSISEMMSPQEWRNSKVFNKLYRPFGITHNACVCFYRGSVCHIFGINSTASLSAEHREMLLLSIPHLKRAYNICVEHHSEGSTVRGRRVVHEKQDMEHVLRSRGFTRREYEVLLQISKGLSNKQIAGELGISSKTVSRHLENIYPKLGCNNRYSVIQKIWEWRLCPAGEETRLNSA